MAITLNDRDARAGYGPHRLSAGSDVVYLKVTSPTRTGIIRKAEFLAAVETELDVIIIDKADLPEVVMNDGEEVYSQAFPGALCTTLLSSDTPERLRQKALAHLALAEYLDANPPVDEAQVEALAGVLRHQPATFFRPGGDGYYESAIRDLARRLVERGVRVEVGS